MKGWCRNSPTEPGFRSSTKKAGGEVQSWSSEGVRLCSFKVFLGSRKSFRSSSTSVRSTVARRLLRGTNLSTLLWKGCASRFLSIATAESGLTEPHDQGKRVRFLRDCHDFQAPPGQVSFSPATFVTESVFSPVRKAGRATILTGPSMAFSLHLGRAGMTPARRG